MKVPRDVSAFESFSEYCCSALFQNELKAQNKSSGYMRKKKKKIVFIKNVYL